jgi:type I restriction enzyme, R subunit
MDLNEFQTRRDMIDVALNKAGWNVKNLAQVQVEVDTKQSDFVKHHYKDVDETLKNDLESKYADYLLLDDTGGPLAIIEAKRTSKDPLLAAQTQARLYAEDIFNQTGKNVFIFLSNGYEIYYWNYPHEDPRLLKAFLTKDDLEKRKWINENKLDLSKVEINKNIVDRSKSIESCKRVLSHLNKGHRKALIVMATGTGKTRVSMSIIDALKRAKWAQKILFIADRKTLRNQAMDKGYKKFFPDESKEKIYGGVINIEKSLFVTTIQTLQECYSDISPGFFDVIISDEAHRSIYNKWRDIFTYYDAIQIGLTATPREAFDSDDMRDTFRFFGCNDGFPTAMYDFEEAVDDGVLVDFREQITGAQTNFQVKGLKKSDLTQSQLNELVGKGINPESIDFEGSQFEKKFVTKGTNEAIIQELMENCFWDQSGTLPAKTIVFAMTKKHAKRLMEAFSKLYPDYPGVAKVIVSDDSYAQKSIEQFEKESLPRIAISVDMLDTGVDVPEICNLVFAKPVFSKIKFWQMLGRGTRADEICEYRDRLPDGKKEYFKVFDFWNNFEYFQMKPDGVKNKASESIATKLFRVKVEQMDLLRSKNMIDESDKLRQKIKKEIQSLPMDSIPIKEKLRYVQKALSDDFYNRKGLNPIQFLLKEISPLVKYNPTNYEEASFTMKCRKLGLGLLKKQDEIVAKFSQQIVETLECIPENINGLNVDFLNEVRRESYWENITYLDTVKLIEEFTPFIKYKLKQPRVQIVVDLADSIVQRKLIQFGPEAKEDYAESYRQKVEEKIKQIVDSHPTVQKIRQKQSLTDEDVEALETTLNCKDLYFTEDVLRQFYTGTFVQFIKEILGMYKEEKPEDKIKEAFESYLVEKNKHYSADQFHFIRTLQTVFTKEKHIDYDMLWEAPFENLGFAPTDLFSEEELQEWIQFCNALTAKA